MKHGRHGTRLRVGVAGATGYAGQELVRLLARHPHVAAGLGDGLERIEPARDAARPGAHLGRRGRPRSTVDTLARDSDAVFLALPGRGVGRARAAAARTRRARLRPLGRLPPPRRRRRARGGIPKTGAVPPHVVYGLTERAAGRTARRAAGVLSRVLSDRRGARRSRRSWTPGSSPATSSSTRSRASRAPARRRASARISPSATAACRRTACSRTGTPPKSSRSSASAVTFVPHLVPLDRGILETIYMRVTRRHDRGARLPTSTGAPTRPRRSSG